MCRDQVVACPEVRLRDYGVDVLQRHVEVTKAPNHLRRGNLLDRVPTIACLRINFGRLQQTDPMIVPQRPDTEVRGARKVADGE